MQIKQTVVLVLLAVAAALSLGSPLAAQTFMSNELEPAGGETEITVDVDGTTATTWELQQSTDGGTTWGTIQSGDAQGSGKFSVHLDAPLVHGRKYRVKGNTSGQSGPYEAELTAS